MDLGRPVARHTIRRPHEAITLDPAELEKVAAQDEAAEEQPAGSETAER